MDAFVKSWGVLVFASYKLPHFAGIRPTKWPNKNHRNSTTNFGPPPKKTNNFLRIVFFPIFLFCFLVQFYGKTWGHKKSGFSIPQNIQNRPVRGHLPLCCCVFFVCFGFRLDRQQKATRAAKINRTPHMTKRLLGEAWRFEHAFLGGCLRGGKKH